MKIRAAVAWEAGAELSIEEFDLDEPRDDEILVRVEAQRPAGPRLLLRPVLVRRAGAVGLAAVMAAVESLATHGTASVITSSGAPVTVPPGSLLLKGRSLRGSMGGQVDPTVFIPRLLELHRPYRFPVDRLVRNYPFAEVNSAIADSLSGATIEPVLTFN